MVRRMRYGVHQPLEDEADRLLKQSLQGQTSCSDKSDILTPAKETHRRRREVYVSTGTPDPAFRLGVYGRVTNTSLPHLNSRDGVSPATRTIRNSSSSSLGGLRGHMQSEFGG